MSTAVTHAADDFAVCQLECHRLMLRKLHADGLHAIAGTRTIDSIEDTGEHIGAPPAPKRGSRD